MIPGEEAVLRTRMISRCGDALNRLCAVQLA
mgnify:CR=1 FL=1